ncbi:nucleoside deaminase [Gordonia sp. ABSL11-1]|uniref:nucleoside deaminase n=1 Tax=Gordonia sp. ABSL11-1 TaxID=3053924 RepID=UPI0025746F2C|nr:nucleoside deaminase [Gordonia sp. ABSL11-1]MDL9946014.1 nucleoside deaminase [Gordonia sp. ABSL11-1]
MTITDADIRRLRRCVDLAQEAFDDGDEPFGSILVADDGTELFADRNRVSGGDATAHPEFAIARWAATHLSSQERTASTVYTSGEHCPMCSAAHAWVGLGRIVYASSSAQLQRWLAQCDAPPSPVAALPIRDVAPNLEVDGPVAEFAPTMRELHHARVSRDAG